MSNIKATKEIEEVFSQIAQYMSMQKELDEIIDGLKDEVKGYMIANQAEELDGLEHKAFYKDVTSATVDTSALKKYDAAIAEKYTKSHTVKRFTFT